MTHLSQVSGLGFTLELSTPARLKTPKRSPGLAVPRPGRMSEARRMLFQQATLWGPLPQLHKSSNPLGNYLPGSRSTEQLTRLSPSQDADNPSRREHLATRPRRLRLLTPGLGVHLCAPSSSPNRNVPSASPGPGCSHEGPRSLSSSHTPCLGAGDILAAPRRVTNVAKDQCPGAPHGSSRENHTERFCVLSPACRD